MLPSLGGMATLTSNQRAIGYTVTDQIDYKGVMVGEVGTYTMGAYMPGQRLEDYKGCKIVGIRVAAARDLGRTTMLLNTPGASGVETLHEQKQRIYEGWNEVMFNGFDYEITGENDIFYGFDYTETEDMVKNEEGGLCSVGDEYTDAFVLYQGGDYYSVSGAGKLCVQLIVDVTNMAAEKMSIGYFDYGFKYKKPSEGLQIFSNFNNVGLNTVDNFRIAVSVDGKILSNETIVPEAPLKYGEYYTLDKTFSLDGVETGGHDVKVYVDQINGKDFNGLDRAKGGKMAIYTESLPRAMTYIEVYADQNSYNSASLDAGFAQMKNDLGEKVTVVKNFRPGNKLAVADGAYLHSLYAYTWPSFTSNRSHFPGETYVAYDMNDYLSIFPGEFTAAILEDIAEQDLENPAFADLTLKGTVGEGRTLEVEATGNIMPVARSIYGDLALTVMLVEDEVISSQVNTSGRVNSKYSHDDVLRAYVTPAKGVTLDSTKPTFTNKFSVVLPEGYDLSKLRLTGILTQAGEANENNLYDYDVINTANAKIENLSGIESIMESASEGKTKYYNLQGVEIPEEELGSGVYVRVDSDGRTRKVSL